VVPQAHALRRVFHDTIDSEVAMWYADNHMRVAGLCDYCLDDFEDLPPVFIRGYAFLAAHRPGDKYGGDCAYWLDWQEYGRWETNRGSQGERKWPDGREWNPEPWTDEPKEAIAKTAIRW
jgi:hypothetical protein